jgi:hypothetical protein
MIKTNKAKLRALTFKIIHATMMTSWLAILFLPNPPVNKAGTAFNVFLVSGFYFAGLVVLC